MSRHVYFRYRQTHQTEAVNYSLDQIVALKTEQEVYEQKKNRKKDC
jgi:hypothetical protein